jgi:hypothetical protein
MNGLFECKLGITFANKETVLELNGCSIEPLEEELTAKGYTAIDSQWITPG